MRATVRTTMLPPRLRPSVVRTLATVRRLHRRLAAAFPTALALLHDPSFAERFDTTSEDHHAAAALRAAAALVDALTDLAEPVPIPDPAPLSPKNDDVAF